ncbi:monovalent cation/H(+) antiporter subunit G [Methylonatrum kenyense]|nr:monovalent cation/H(+) antiporter subunit G [Methylonatrum kenyense]MCK8517063.1 monovalent cation/H(+) antiporter subunit G [Methylonatrum kenyense]
MASITASVLIVVGTAFYIAGTVGLLRFPDIHSRLHALTKADNTGLGFLALGVALLSGSPRLAVLIALVWLLALIAASVACHLIARYALDGTDSDSEPRA